MRIGYIAKHNSGGNDDEGAITFALQQLGHEVVCISEMIAHRSSNQRYHFVLFHHWNDPNTLEGFRCPKVFWNFDLVTYPDATLQRRNDQRVKWMETMTPIVDIGFCTDGDWVAQDKTGKLYWLLQGADERTIGSGDKKGFSSSIIFTGNSRGGGVGRESFVVEMKERYGNDFCQVQGLHGRSLANVIASSKIVVAPDHPVTDRYWSNRVFNTLGFGGFLLHPRCKELEKMYEDGVEIDYYDSRPELHEKIKHRLASPITTRLIGSCGWERTVKEHLYRHRVEQLIKIIQERLF